MIGKIKATIQEKLYNDCINEYKRELRFQTDPYLLWIKENESFEKNEVEESYPTLGVVYMDQCGADFSLENINKEFIIFISSKGKFSVHAFREIIQYFEKHENTDIVYADEDIWMNVTEPEQEYFDTVVLDEEQAHRIFPWTKPMWSPDTLLSFFYFGNIWAIRKSAFKDTEWLGDSDYKKNIYDFVLKATEKGKRAGHIEKILFHAYREGKNKSEIENLVMHDTAFIGVGQEYDFIREAAFKRRGLNGKMLLDQSTGITYPYYECAQNPLVSIIIPSKDNYEVLKQCIISIYQHTSYKNYEIIVVDNGSSAQTRMYLEKLKEEYKFNYIYMPMEFNFSKMCNLGVKASKGEYVLMLNDDMEAIDDMWLSKMLGQASLKHVGAVGAKLLYPNTNLIQHVGISNTVYGPGHKLKQMDDGKSYYYGRNRFVYDMIGVTAACLLMRKSYFMVIGGFYEGLAVAYNDVDLCFRLCTKGLYNVIRNDVVLYHHESLSRGDDMKDEKKMMRLMTEKKELYRRHPRLYKQDPFIGTLMNSGEPEYHCRWLEGYELVNMAVGDKKITESKKLPNPKKMNNAIMVVVEECDKEKYTKKPFYMIKGWAYIPGVDNAKYQLKLLFCNSKGQVWELPVEKRYRKDVAAILPDETNVELTGFCSWLFEGELPPDTYDLWMYAKDACSRQRLYRNMEKQLVVD